MSNIDEAAFPVVHHSGGVQYFGMSLRDYFAAKAMQGRLAVPGYVDVEQDAAMAYRMADAMLKERSK